MKKILLSLLLLFTGVAVSNARSDVPNDIRSALFEYLSVSGHDPSYDEDDDILFLMGDLLCYAICSSPENDYLMVEIRLCIESEQSLDDLLRVANVFNRKLNLCKCSVEPGRFQISMEFAASSVAQVRLQTEQALIRMPAWMDMFIRSTCSATNTEKEDAAVAHPAVPPQR